LPRIFARLVRHRTEVTVDGVFFWLAGVGCDGRLRVANDRGGDVQRMTPETTGSFGEHRDGRWVAAVDDNGGRGSGGRG
jgi:hypothetical protein